MKLFFQVMTWAGVIITIVSAIYSLYTLPDQVLILGIFINKGQLYVLHFAAIIGAVYSVYYLYRRKR